MSAQAVDWVGVYNAIKLWAWQAAGIEPARVRALVDRDLGEAKGPAPKATIELISLVPTSKGSRRVLPQIMRQRYRVTAPGPGEVGIDFYPSISLTPQRISIAAGPGDPPATSAAALLAELTANLPAGYTASADPEDATAILLDGSEAEPLFASVSANLSLLTVTTPRPRFPYLGVVEHRVVWRITFRTGQVAAAATQATAATGPRFAADLMTRAMAYRNVLDRYLLPLGFRHGGTANSQPDVPNDRSESTATLDVAYFGLFTGIEAANAMRLAGINTTAT